MANLGTKRGLHEKLHIGTRVADSNQNLGLHSVGSVMVWGHSRKLRSWGLWSSETCYLTPARTHLSAQSWVEFGNGRKALMRHQVGDPGLGGQENKMCVWKSGASLTVRQ